MALYQHRRNVAEQAIRTFKNHFIAGLCTLPEELPIELWDELIKQAELTLNLMRGSRLHPQMLAYAHSQGTYRYSKYPIAPPGIKVVVHEKPDQRKS